MDPVAGSVVLVTGASRGLGVDVAQAFAAEGARLALCARSEKELTEVGDRLRGAGAEAAAIPADVGDLEALRALVPEVERQVGPVDVLVNNAGIEKPWDFEALDLQDITNVVTVNLLGAMWLTRLVLPGMIERRRGHVVNMASVAGLVPVPHNTAYSATKHALVGFSRPHGAGRLRSSPAASTLVRWQRRR